MLKSCVIPLRGRGATGTVIGQTPETPHDE
jgi:hypothetical protein